MRSALACLGCRALGPALRCAATGAPIGEVLAGRVACPLGRCLPIVAAPAAGTPQRPQAIGAAELGRARRAICRGCDEYNGNVCERQFPRGVCLTTFTAWTERDASACPHPDGSRWERAAGDLTARSAQQTSTPDAGA